MLGVVRDRNAAKEGSWRFKILREMERKEVADGLA